MQENQNKLSSQTEGGNIVTACFGEGAAHKNSINDKDGLKNIFPFTVDNGFITQA